MTCENDVFDGVYQYNSWKRSWMSDAREFSIAISTASNLQWVIEDDSNLALVSESYSPAFETIPLWELKDRTTGKTIENMSCLFTCSSTLLPSKAPSTFTNAPSKTPSMAPTTTTLAPTKKSSLLIENHLVTDNKAFSETDENAWKAAINQLMFGSEEIHIISIDVMKRTADDEVPQRRELANPSLNITAEVFFATEANRDTQFDSLMDEAGRDNKNSILNLMFMFQPSLATVDSEYIGLLGEFDGEYFVPTNQPTNMPTSYPTDSPTFIKKITTLPPTSFPSVPPTVELGTTIVITIDGADPNDPDLPDDITDVTDDVTNTTTTVISVIENPDGTVTITIDCPDCNPADDLDTSTDVQTQLTNNNDGEFNVLSVNTGGAAKNGGDGGVTVMTTGEEWMFAAIIVGSVLVLYAGYKDRKRVKRCVLCKSKPKVIEVPEGVFEVAEAAEAKDYVEDFFANPALMRQNSASSVWTQYTSVFHDQRINAHVQDQEGGETINVMPANVMERDGMPETGADGDVETGADGDLETGGDEWDNQSESAVDVSFGDVSYGVSLDVKEYETGGDELGEQGCDSPSAVTYVDSPTNLSDVTATEKREPSSRLNSMFSVDHGYGGSQDLSGFDSPSACEQVFFPPETHHVKRDAYRNLKASTTEDLEEDWNAHIDNEYNL